MRRRWILAVGAAVLCSTASADETRRAPLVVLDPGHGGANPGALGVTGIYEKQLTLALSRKVARRLRERGISVALTRDKDEYLTLRQRSRRANELGADLFVSLHANASPAKSQRGFETFVLTPEAVDVDGRALRAFDGAPRPGVDPEVGLVLDDVERGAAFLASADLAAAIQRALVRARGADRDRRVRQESQHVLLGATMPAVLVEVGFIDHEVEGRELAADATQDAIADAIAGAIVETLRPD